MVSFKIKERPLDMIKSDLEYFSIPNHIKLTADTIDSYSFKKRYYRRSTVSGKIFIQAQLGICSIIFDRKRFIFNLLFMDLVLFLVFLFLLIQTNITSLYPNVILLFIIIQPLFSFSRQKSLEREFLNKFMQFFSPYIDYNEQIQRF